MEMMMIILGKRKIMSASESNMNPNSSRDDLGSSKVNAESLKAKSISLFLI